MQKQWKYLPSALCALYAFYPLMLLLGGKLKFGYEPRPIPYAAMVAALSIAASVILLKKKPAYGRFNRIAMALTLPLCCINAFFMMSMADSAWALAMAGVSCIACIVFYFERNFKRWYTRLIGFIVLVPMLAYVSMFLLMGFFMLDFGNVELLRSYEKDNYICYDYYVDEGALGEGWYTDVYSKQSYPLLFGVFHPHYERIHSDTPL